MRQIPGIADETAESHVTELLTRRASLARFGGLLVAVATGGWWKVRPSEVLLLIASG